MSFKNKTVLITGASRGIGKAIALRLAKEGAQIVIAAKSVTEDPRLGGTIYSAAEEIEQAGGQALAVPCDIREEDQIRHVVEQAVAKFGGIDVLVNNASAISLTGTEATVAKRFDLMHDINVRGTFLVTQHCIPHLRQSENAHILTLSPPLNMDVKWFAPHVAYTLAKYNMSMLTLGWAEEFRKDRIAANALWPFTTIATAAVQNLLGGETMARMSRTPDIIAEAAYQVLRQPADSCTGHLFLDEEVLKQYAGIDNFDSYAVVPGGKLQKDLFL
ncbi:NAD(P)-dependent oxidoreductase [Chitinophaga pendula]|uniref:SDR family oxidoreductase n=1 Tax=Chitinophaga TaxID=79328 RepID=UPI000BAF85D3|nr:MULTISPECIES: NAD(P)-dependent oxidoreductase [Chitinophaga]ASZ13004.1 short chain dehydrogenase [Chitinophaga sp. MD30]UCJ09366.1 NAD(P)-dependent oxidoreductase [Chitinophaga pendula]